MSLTEDYASDRSNSESPIDDETAICIECGKSPAEKDSFYCESCWDELDRLGYFDYILP